MKRKLLFYTLIITIFHTVSAQKEVYFNTTKPEEVKVESMQGVDIESSFSPISIIDNLTYQKKSWGIPLSIGYFNEKRIASTWTLLSRIKLQNNLSNTPVLSYDSINHGYGYDMNSPYKATYSLGIGISIEPRWYFSYKKRFQVGKAKLNSGWFLSLPLSLNSTLINTYKPDMIDEYYSNYKAYCSLGLTGILGYRQAISKQWFLEGNLQLINLSSQIYSLNNKINISQPWIIIFPGISLKAAYTFK